jgi:hypothetical protein
VGAGVAARLKTASELLDLCRALGRQGRGQALSPRLKRDSVGES